MFNIYEHLRTSLVIVGVEGGQCIWYIGGYVTNLLYSEQARLNHCRPLRKEIAY